MKYLIALVGSWIVLATSFAEIPPKERAVLSGYAGKSEMSIEGSSKLRGDVRGEWTLGLEFLQQTWTLDAIPGVSPKLSGTTMLGYDAAKRVYRISRFVSDGSSGTGEGAWDEATRTLTWTIKDTGTGQTTVLKSTFAEDRAESWERATTGSDGKVISMVRGKNLTRSQVRPYEKATEVLERFGAFTITDGASWYRFSKGGKFESGPMGMSGRALEGKWTLVDDDKFKVVAKYGWINGTSMINDYRQILFRILFLEKRPEKVGISFGAPTELFDAYWHIDEFVKIPKPE